MVDVHSDDAAILGKAEGSPTKDFFVTMLTRDISIQDCILDLLDNSWDGARRTVKALGHDIDTAAYSGTGVPDFTVELTCNADAFTITDNCGGIPLSVAKKYAFHFGRLKDAPKEASGIGIYGIGMKRALFKLGSHSEVTSTSDGDAYSVVVDVPKWLAQGEENWDFDIIEAPPLPHKGTRIVVRPLHGAVAPVLSDSTFLSELRRTIARDYSFIFAKGFSVRLNDAPITPYEFTVKDGGEMEPVRWEGMMGDVRVEIVAGFMASPQEDVEPENDKDPNADYYGWYVACNDRIVLAGDKTDKSVWDRGERLAWHPQYNGFLGIVRFWSDDPRKLPWKTTKRDVDLDSPVYRSALVRMRAITREFTAYTGQRKNFPDAAKAAEAHAAPRPVATVAIRSTPSFPRLAPAADDLRTISYKVVRARLEAVAKALGGRGLSNREVGIKTFEYYERNEVD